MKKLLSFLILICGLLSGQENKPQYTAEVSYYYGSILPHSPGILHLITAHPEGVMLTVNRKTFGEKEWESRLNYPDFGVTLHYQNNKNKELGDLYGLFGHYSF
ncbi:MAG: acyloxyacyl hydrolase, partial [Moheibacter sp.]